MIAGVLLAYLVVTGIALQFSPELGLGARTVANDWVLDWYGLEAPAGVRVSGVAAEVGGELFWRRQPLGAAGRLLGALALDDVDVVATESALILIPRDTPELRETLAFASPLSGIALHEDRVHLLSADEVLRLDPALLNSTPVATPAAQIRWVVPQTPDAAAAQAYRQLYRYQLLSIERIFQDLHSGRFFGAPGIWLVNLASLMLIALAATGYWIWWRSRSC